MALSRDETALKLKIYLVDGAGEKYMGAGVLWLLEGVRLHGSIRKAAEEMHLSYTKAHTMLKKLEDAVGQPILQRRRGGDSRDGASLTEFGASFIQAYDRFQKELKQEAEEGFQRFLKEL